LRSCVGLEAAPTRHRQKFLEDGTQQMSFACNFRRENMAPHCTRASPQLPQTAQASADERLNPKARIAESGRRERTAVRVSGVTAQFHRPQEPDGIGAQFIGAPLAKGYRGLLDRSGSAPAFGTAERHRAWFVTWDDCTENREWAHAGGNVRGPERSRRRLEGANAGKVRRHAN